MADFKETMICKKHNEELYGYAWYKYDLSIDGDETYQCIGYDSMAECSFEEMINAIGNHYFDIDRVYNYFIDKPEGTLTLIEEY